MAFSRRSALAIVAMIAAFAPQAALADDRISLESGRSAGRGLLILRAPAVLGLRLVDLIQKANHP